MSDFFTNLQAVTDNLNDIVFTKYAKVTNITSDGSLTVEEENGLQHENIPNFSNKTEIGDIVVIDFVDNSVYNPICVANITHTLKASFDEMEEALDELDTALGNKADKVHTHLSEQITDLIDVIYPIGSIYMSVNSVNPATLFGGEWEQIKDKFLLSAGDIYSNASTGGEATHTLTTNEMPSHRHTAGTYDAYSLDNQGFANGSTQGIRINMSSSTSSTRIHTNYEGGGQAHNNMPPYLTVNVWKRTG